MAITLTTDCTYRGTSFQMQGGNYTPEYYSTELNRTILQAGTATILQTDGAYAPQTFDIPARVSTSHLSTLRGYATGASGTLSTPWGSIAARLLDVKNVRMIRTSSYGVWECTLTFLKV